MTKPIHPLGLLKDNKPCRVCKELTRLYNTENKESICLDCYFGVKK